MRISRSHVTSSLACLLAAGTVQYAQADSLENWNGCYAGVNAGYGRASISGIDSDISAAIGSATATGGAFGGQLGCDHQTANWVSGMQLTLDKTHLTGSHPYIDGSGPADRVTYEIKSLISITGRIGYLLQPDTLAYFKAGGAWTRTNHDDSDPGAPYTGNREVTRNGWLAGVGLEHKIGRNFSSYVEYNYMDFGRQTVTIAYSDGEIANYSFKQTMNYLGFGVNYRF
jgi:outer membrane immunogenic protein